jgi:prepilin-type processing-associated H-X9-DG protein
MNCPKCGKENPDNAQVCSSCGSELSKASKSTDVPTPKMSSLAIAAFVLGILSLFTCGLTTIPAIILGVIGFVLIEKSGGKLTGSKFAVLGVVLSVVLSCGIVVPVMLRMRQTAFRLSCATNLSQIGMSILVYANDYDGAYPHSAGKSSIWSGHIRNWRADNRFDAYGLAADGSGGQGSITSCFYLLVKYSHQPPLRTFVCRGDAGVTVFNLADEGVKDRKLVDFWDFGPKPSKHCSYSFQMPFGPYGLTKSSEPGMAVVADRNPLQDSPAAAAKSWPGIYTPDGGRKAVRYGNAITHQEDGQNVLFVDSHVAFEKRSFCGINDDNIYTFWDGGDIRIGAQPIIGWGPQDSSDSLLVDDGS